jgi:hypothetical protein
MSLPPFGPGDFARLAQYTASQREANCSPYEVAPVVATYASQQQRIQAIEGALPEDRAQYQAGVVVGSATRFYPARRGGIGIVVSPLQNTAQVSADASNEWHAVGVLRHGASLWVYDPAYRMDSHARLPMIPGVSNVMRLLNSTGFGNITYVQVRGDASESEDCMARAARWVDQVTSAGERTDGPFIEGQPTPGWQVIARS